MIAPVTKGTSLCSVSLQQSVLHEIDFGNESFGDDELVVSTHHRYNVVDCKEITNTWTMLWVWKVKCVSTPLGTQSTRLRKNARGAGARTIPTLGSCVFYGGIHVRCDDRTKHEHPVSVFWFCPHLRHFVQQIFLRR